MSKNICIEKKEEILKKWKKYKVYLSPDNKPKVIQFSIIQYFTSSKCFLL